MPEKTEITLNTLECSVVALTVYRRYLEWTQTPQFAIVPFDEWLERIIEKENAK